MVQIFLQSGFLWPYTWKIVVWLLHQLRAIFKPFQLSKTLLQFLFFQPRFSKHFSRIFFNFYSPAPPPVWYTPPQYSLSLVFSALIHFEPLATYDLSFLSFNIAFLLVITSMQRVGELKALWSCPTMFYVIRLFSTLIWTSWRFCPPYTFPRT